MNWKTSLGQTHLLMLSEFYYMYKKVAKNFNVLILDNHTCKCKCLTVLQVSKCICLSVRMQVTWILTDKQPYDGQMDRQLDKLTSLLGLFFNFKVWTEKLTWDKHTSLCCQNFITCLNKQLKNLMHLVWTCANTDVYLFCKHPSVSVCLCECW
jgi:CXCXC repeat